MSEMFPLVTIRCLVYNHEPYLRQCLEGFVMQKTNFPFEAIVHDDASTDGSAAIIREYAEKYPDIIKPVYEVENQYSKHDGSLRRKMDVHMRGKYIAMCEGDDYWIDSHKLQKQVDFLESHPDYGLVHTDFELVNESNILEYRIKRNCEKSENALIGLLLGSYNIGTLTVLFRSNIYKSLPRYNYSQTQKYPMGDLPLWIEIASVSKIAYLKDVTSCYRRLTTSASHSSDFQKRISFVNASFDCRLFYLKKLGLMQWEKELQKNLLLTKLKITSSEGTKKEIMSVFFALMKRCHLLVPLKAYYYLSIAYFPSIPKVIVWFQKQRLKHI